MPTVYRDVFICLSGEMRVSEIDYVSSKIVLHAHHFSPDHRNDRVTSHVDNMSNRPNDNDGNNNNATVKQQPVLTETLLNRSKSDGLLFEHSESERNYKSGE